MVFCFSALTGGEVSKIVSQSTRKKKELPISNPVDALEEFHAEHVDSVSTTAIYTAFEANWNAQQTSNTGENREKKKIVRALWNTFWKDVLKAAFFKLLWGVFLIFSIAFFVFRILAYIRFKSTDPVHTTEEASESYILCAFFFVSMVCLSVSLQQMTFASTALGQRVKAALTTAIYRKMLIREGFESDADVVSLVAKDCPKIAEACTSLQFLWSGIFEALGIFAVLISYIGVSALPGLGFLLICLPLQYALGMWLAVKKNHLAKDSKKRIKLMEEILRGIKLIKIYGWESYFRDAIDACRAHEGSVVDAINRIKSVILGIVFSCPPFFCLVIFGTQEALGSFDGTLAFTTLTFFNTLRLPLVKLPKGLRDVLDAKLALERIEAFLRESELPDRAKPVDDPPSADARPPASDAMVNAALVIAPVSSVSEDITPYPTGPGITFAAASFAYGARAPALLHDINLSLPRGSLAMVAGPVASGKTNLLRAVLGHMTCQSGSRAVGGAFAYVPQVPWTALGTVRDNILFGRPWDEARYRRVVWACALETDLLLMAAGDLTYIGERGGNLSGGQKQRIAIARAAYSGADVFVLDSPLSAVDMHTCQHIFRHCIQGIMLAGGGTVALATHQTELFPLADTLIVMAAGRTVYTGPYDFASIRPYFPLAADLSHPAEAANTTAPPPGEVAGPSSTLVLLPPGTTHQEAAAAAAAAASGGDSEGRPATATATATVESEAGGGKVRRSPYLAYVEYAGVWLFVVSMVVLAGAQVLRSFSDIWISRWTTRAYPNRSEEWYILVYFGYVMCFFLAAIFRAYLYLFMGLRAAGQAHDRALGALLRAPMAYFITEPVGNLLAFFSKDMDAIDDVLVDNSCMCFIYFWLLLSNLGVVSGTIPIFAAIVGGFFVVFLYVFRCYTLTCTRVKVAVGRAADEVVAHTSETLSGLAVVRAFGSEDRFRAMAVVLQDRSSTMGQVQGTLALWLAFRLDLVGVLLVLANCLLAVFNEGSISASATGLAVSNSFQILLFFSVMTATMGEIHAGTGAIDRAVDLAAIAPERDGQGEAPSPEERGISAAWPDRGEVSFAGVVMPYLPGAPPVLRGVDCTLLPGEKVGVVGRTGAGKSSLIVALYRLVEPSAGTICVDGVDVARLSLGSLRRRIAIIPQEPVMFAGTLRSNLDPFRLRTDAELLAALEACLLGPAVKATGLGLDAPVEFAGGNFSLGQQQLVCLARAMLNPSRLLLLDEATAALDSDTDAAVQQVLRRHFANRTTLTIAHRLDTIIDSDRILVLDAGRVCEFAPPAALLADPNSSFSSLCRRTGPAQYRALQAAAAAAAAARATPAADQAWLVGRDHPA